MKSKTPDKYVLKQGGNKFVNIPLYNWHKHEQELDKFEPPLQHTN